jgi:hypothetical protein
MSIKLETAFKITIKDQTFDLESGDALNLYNSLSHIFGQKYNPAPTYPNTWPLTNPNWPFHPTWDKRGITCTSDSGKSFTFGAINAASNNV